MLEHWEATDIYGRIRAGRGQAPPVDPARRAALRQRPHPHGAPRSTRCSRTSSSSRAPCWGTTPSTCPAGTATACPSSIRWTRSSGSTPRRSTCAAPWIRSRRSAAAASTRPEYIDIQREEFKRLGVFGDWNHPYLTMEPAYEATIVREFGRFVGRGHRLQGPQARALVHALQDRAGPGRGGVRGPAHAERVREVPGEDAVGRARRGARRQARVARDLDDDAVDLARQPGDRRAPRARPTRRWRWTAKRSSWRGRSPAPSSSCRA